MPMGSNLDNAVTLIKRALGSDIKLRKAVLNIMKKSYSDGSDDCYKIIKRKNREETPPMFPFNFTTIEEIENKEKVQNDSFKKWICSGEFRFLHTRNRAELEDYMRGCFREMADLQSEILRLKKM